MKPRTRLDNFLALIAGDENANASMKPRTPKEKYLADIAANNSGGEDDEP